jgi:lipopolysaccharide transport system ATP-binding protein
MSDTIIKVENLSKKYLLTHLADKREQLFSRFLVNKAKSAATRLASSFRSGSVQEKSTEEFWALDDVSFEIKQGDRVGIIGRNGAGKSTLLKILSRITEPTRGRITIDGRVASLLEVGTGFHSELSGRENIYLNGAILGMSREEIKRKFDEIVAFAEVEQFLDTPVKRYSSGMYVRLAFAVAAHLEPEILVVDEVLAVGDAEFQKKCLGKMEDVSAKEGRTVLFVSHNMNAIEQLCSSSLLLEKGKVKLHTNDVSSSIRKYSVGDDDYGVSEWVQDGSAAENAWFSPVRFMVTDADGNKVTTPVANNSDIWVQIEADIKELDSALTVGYAIYAEEGALLYWSYQTDDAADKWPVLEKGFCTLRSKIPERFLNEGMYRIELIGSLHFRQWLFEPGRNAPFIILNIQGGLSDSPYWMAKRPGALAPVIEWEKLRSHAKLVG